MDETPVVNKRAESLAKARAAKQAKKFSEANVVMTTAPASVPLGGTSVTSSLYKINNDDLIWREAMVAQIVNGRCVSPQQLDGCAKLADAYLKMVKDRFQK